MDSCHIFNFLFGTKKATTELSKCFSSLSESARRSRRCSKDNDRASTSSSSAPPAGVCRASQSQPSSPLKQIQMKIASLTSGNATNSSKSASIVKNHQERNHEARSPRGTSCDAKCGTYRATLVRLKSNSDVEDECEDENLLGPSPEKPNAESLPDMMIKSTQRQEESDQLLIVADAVISDKGEKLDMLDNSTTTECYREHGQASQRTATRFEPRQVVLYGNCEQSQTSDGNYQSSGEQLITSAEIYTISPSSNDPPRASKLYLTNTIGMKRPSVDSFESNPIESTRAGDIEDKVTDKRQAYVRSLVKSIESNGSFDSDIKHQAYDQQEQTPTFNSKNRHKPTVSAITTTGYSKPVTFVKPMPPKTPPKTNKVKCLNLQISLNKPYKIQQLFQEDTFLARFFDKLEPLDRCVAAQVCRKWRDVLYANQHYWKDLINVIDCTQLRRDHLVDCILNTLQTSAKLQNSAKRQAIGAAQVGQKCNIYAQDNSHEQNGVSKVRSDSTDSSIEPSSPMTNVLNLIDQDDVWRIQELCNKFTNQKQHHQSARNQNSERQVATVAANANETTTNLSSNSKSSSIPSQISSTFSSVSLSSLLLSPLSESNKIETMKEKLYNSLDDRGFDALCLFGATDEDVEDLVAKLRPNSQRRIIIGRLNNCCVSDKGLDLFIKTFSQIQELELSGCNEISNSIELRPLQNLRRLIITDSINIADGFAQQLSHLLPQLDELTLQAYHLTDAFLDYLSLSVNSSTSRLRRLELPNCKEITNQSLVTIAKHFPQLEALSISGSTKIGDDGIEILAELARQLKVLDLSWCTRITDASLECIACDLSDNLTDLILDRNVNITDTGLGYLATMIKLGLLHIRWCPRVSDIGLESVLAIKSLRYLSLAGLHQVTARSLLCLVDANLHEVELTNCPAVNNDLLGFLEQRMPNCNIIF